MLVVLHDADFYASKIKMWMLLFRTVGKKIMMERSLQTATASVQKMAVSRPTNLPNLQKDTDQSTQELLQRLYKNSKLLTNPPRTTTKAKQKQ